MSSTETLATITALKSHSLQIRPRFEGSNINTWIGFKHVMYMIEEAVLDTLRSNDLSPRELFEAHGLCFEIVDSDARILTAYHMDDQARFDILPAIAADKGEIVFKVTGFTNRNGREVKAVAATVRAIFRIDPSVSELPSIAPALASVIHSRIARLATELVSKPAASPANKNPALSLTAAERELSVERGTVAQQDSLIDHIVPAGANAFVWKWHVPYFYCHFNERMQHSGYLRLMEEVVDLFLAERGISIRTMMQTRNWIPVVPTARVNLLDEARMEETIYVVYTVEEIFKATTYTSRMDVYALRDSKLIQTATGHITHGYAKILDRSDWSLVEFDTETLAALNNQKGQRLPLPESEITQKERSPERVA